MKERTKIILIDNDPDELFFMDKGFRASRLYQIIGQLSDGRELKSYLSCIEELPDLIITDLNMPGQSGLQIANEIAAHPKYASIKVIVLSIAVSYDLEPGPTGKTLLMPKPKSLLEYGAFALDLHERYLAIC